MNNFFARPALVGDVVHLGDEWERLVEQLWAAYGECRMPVPAFSIALGLGFEVLEKQLEGSHGLAIAVRGRERVVLNSADHETEKRLVCGHEIAHLLLFRGGA